MVQTHIPLKADGIFGDITEAYVVNFQKYKKVKPEDGTVTEKVWILML
jgi:peptidoglycan hydrolase-like protein with peptidoglycan-binding domain